MRTLILLILLLTLAFTAGAQTAKQDSAHLMYHLMRKRDTKQNNPYTFADSTKAKKATAKPKKKTR